MSVCPLLDSAAGIRHVRQSQLVHNATIEERVNALWCTVSV